MAAPLPQTGPAPTRPAATRGRAVRRRPHLRVVGPPRRARRWATILTSLVIAGLFAVVALNALVADAAVAARQLEAEMAALEIRAEELTADVVTLEAPERIARVARDELGMVPATEPGVIVLSAPQRPPVAAVTGAGR